MFLSGNYLTTLEIKMLLQISFHLVSRFLPKADRICFQILNMMLSLQFSLWFQMKNQNMINHSVIKQVQSEIITKSLLINLLG